MPPRRNNRAGGMGTIYVSARRLSIKLCSTSPSCNGRFHDGFTDASWNPTEPAEVDATAISNEMPQVAAVAITSFS
jgi:hypothetical protein